MPLTVTKYRVECDVPGCEKQLEDTPSRLSSSGWGYLLRYGGKPTVEQFNSSLPSVLVGTRVICPGCQAQGRLADIG